MELTLIRHTEVKIEKGTCYGQSDIDVTETFEKEKNRVLKNIHATNTVVISSPLKRCTRLAGFISKNFQTDNRIMELHFGNWEMQKWDEIEDPEIDIWMNNYISYPCPNGESLLDMKTRVESFLTDLKLQDHQKYIIVTHGGVVRLFYHLIKGIELDKIFDIQIQFGEVHCFNI